MLRLDPGEYRIWTARHGSEGSGECTLRGAETCFRMETAIVTAFAK